MSNMKALNMFYGILSKSLSPTILSGKCTVLKNLFLHTCLSRFSQLFARWIILARQLYGWYIEPFLWQQKRKKKLAKMCRLSWQIWDKGHCKHFCVFSLLQGVSHSNVQNESVINLFYCWDQLTFHPVLWFRVSTRVLQPSPHIYYPTTFPFLFLDQSTGNEGIYLTKMAKVFGEIFLSFLGLHPSFLQVSSRSTIV